MNTACALEAAYAYEYVFARKAAFTSTSWQLVEVAMTVVWDVIRSVQICDERRDGC